jgi:large subunit ribosomal protein L32
MAASAASDGGVTLGACRSKEKPMAVQQNKKSPSKRGMHRSHNALPTPGTAIEPTTGEAHLRHHISPNGFYRGRKVLKTKADA